MLRKIYFNKFIFTFLFAILSHYLQFKWLFDSAEVISEIFIGLLKLISVPVVFLSILSTLSGLESAIELKSLAKRIVSYTLFTTTIAAFISLLLYLVVQPASYMSGVDVAMNGSEVAGLSSYLLQLVPSNFVQAFLDNNVIGVMLIAFIMGVASLQLDDERRATINNIFSSLFELIIQVAHVILKVLPVAVWAFLVAFLNGLESVEEVRGILFYIVCVICANFIQAFVVLPILLKTKGISALETFKGTSQALMLAFFSKSSNATLPTTLKCVQGNLGVSKKVSSFSLPICSTVNMNACAAFILITVLFVAESNGFEFSAMDLIMWVFLSVGAAIGNAGVPMGCYFMATTYLIAMGVPLNIMGLILPLYSILDMFETMINVWSDICVTRVVDKEH